MQKSKKNPQKTNNEITKRTINIVIVFYSSLASRVQCEIANAPKASGVHNENKNHKVKYILALAKYAKPGLIAATFRLSAFGCWLFAVWCLMSEP